MPTYEEIGLEIEKLLTEKQFTYKNYEEIGLEIGKLITEKQIAYGNSFGNSGKILEILFPNGISIEQYTDALTITRIIDKLFRIANNKDAFNESPYKDIAGYAILGYSNEKPQ